MAFKFFFFFLPQSPLLNSCITEATTSIHTPGEFFSTDIKLYFSKLDFFFFGYLWREEVVLIILPFHTAILMTTCWKTLSSLTSCPCGSTAGCSSSKMWLAMRSVVGPSMAKAVRLLKCAVHLLFMPQKRSRQRYVDHITWCSTCYFQRRWQTPDAWRSPSFARWSSQKPEFMRRPSTSYCMNPTMAEVQTTPCWRLQGAQRVDLII